MVQKTITQLGPREAEFLSLVSAEGPHFLSERAVGFWGTRAMAGKKLHQLEKRGWIARLERGKYLVIPLEAGSTRTWSEDSYLIASTLVQPAAIAYWSAVRHWNWTEQIPRVVYIQTTTRKKTPQRMVFGVRYQFVTVPEKKFFGHIKEWRKGKQVLITDMEKTLLDCGDDVGRAGSIEELTKAIKGAVRQISWSKLDEYSKRFPNRSVMKRLGFLFETLVTELPSEATQTLAGWRSRLSAGVVPLQPGGRRAGRIETRWRLRVNTEVG
jgi:predicted transcriptional regulator of viral defense system